MSLSRNPRNPAAQPYRRYVFGAIAILVLGFTTSHHCAAQVTQVAQEPPVSQNEDQDFANELPMLDSLSDLLGDQAPGPSVSVQPVKISAQYMSDTTGTQGVLRVNASVGAGWHLYSMTQAAGGPERAKIELVESDQYQTSGAWTPNILPEKKMTSDFGDPIETESHHGEVYWEVPIELASGVDPATLDIRGSLSGQACNDSGSCMPLSSPATKFVATFGGPNALSIKVPTADALSPAASDATVSGATVSGATVSGGADDATDSDAPTPAGGAVLLAKYLATATLAGFILNFMPCVLPVIGLKVMSFVQQAGQSRSRVLWLNLCFVAGLMTVFMILAALAALANWGWGGLFQLPEFSIAMACIVFVFALSFLGVWEIPSPGFVGAGKTAEISHREGAMGAFFKGVLTTLLATPCTGPFLGSTLAWAVKQPTPVIFGIFACLGLGMGLPYLILALVPGLMSSILPKPGAWMDTFKQIMGFVLLFTVVWLFYSMDKTYFVPTLALLIALWAACWAVGRVPITASFGTKVRTWFSASAFAALLGYLAFTNLLGAEPKLLFSQRADIADHTMQGEHVFVDFTADY